VSDEELDERERKEQLALAKVGLDALVDEPTGYQEQRWSTPEGKKELRKLLRQYRKEEGLDDSEEEGTDGTK